MDKPEDNLPPADPAELGSDQIRQAVAGDEDAIARLIEHLSPLMLAWARLYLRDGTSIPLTAEDLVQDVWLRLLPELRNLHPHPESGRWTPAMFGVIKKTLRNRVIDVRRAALRSRIRPWQVDGSPADSRSAIPQAVDPSSGPVAKVLRGERQQAVRAALEQLTPREREIYLRRLFEDASVAELAAEFGIGEEAVIKARQRVRQRLEGLLGRLLVD